jgi:MutL-like protein
VLRAAELFAEAVGDCVVIDVGGATTDVHSVTDGTPEWTARMTQPEPRTKRTVEGDLGVFVNARNLVAGDPTWEARLGDLVAVPHTGRQLELTRWLCAQAVEIALRRHAGVISDLYTPTGRRLLVKGKDLTAVRWLVGTGGALTRVPGGEATLRSCCQAPGRHLLPPHDAAVLIDRDYLFSALGTLAEDYPDEVRATCRAQVPAAQVR